MFNNYKKLITNQKGFSLPELIIGMIVMVIIMGAIFGIMHAASRSYLYNSSQSRNIAAARDILDTITNELRYGKITNLTFPSGQGSEIDYMVDTPRRIYRITGTPATTSSLVIEHNSIIQRTLAINNLQSITFQRDATNTQLLTVSIVLNNHSYTGSPTFSSTTAIIMPNM